jgi:D-alanyl-D-alanine dipeptidase
VNSDTTLERIDETLTYHSAGLGVDVTVPVEGRTAADEIEAVLLVRLEPWQRHLIEEAVHDRFAALTQQFQVAANKVYRLSGTIQFGVSAMGAYFDEMSDRADRRRARLRRMHRMYRSRR